MRRQYQVMPPLVSVHQPLIWKQTLILAQIRGKGIRSGLNVPYALAQIGLIGLHDSLSSLYMHRSLKVGGPVHESGGLVPLAKAISRER